MSLIECIYCGKLYDKIGETELLKDKEHEEDTEIRRLNCKECGRRHMFSVER